MKIIDCSDYDEMSHLASNSVLAELKNNTDQLFCTATGSSPIGLYKNLALAYQDNAQYFQAVRILMLDEWHGLPAGDPASCDSYIKEHVLGPLSIPSERYFSFRNNAPEPEKECERMEAIISQQGPIDICILGIGMNGHLGFNEPSTELTPGCHVATLSADSKEHAMISGSASKPEFGLTLGIKAILDSKKIILLLTGPSKKEVIKDLLAKKISTQLPASLLWHHSNVECYVDQLSATSSYP
ncbi:MAG: galactosamine-6-phosphate isomerase [Eudoraea sp.]|nr:galactosamine-6-phosphate isomerase [Eudoraea sp.]